LQLVLPDTPAYWSKGIILAGNDCHKALSARA